ncbi:hypothetical protein [Streptomyces xanthii]|uniref:Uncharacterized protein n=1 Tax=Streptomyces xanthii TaxID=2768069 RepID=A0A7H1B1N9_9ACTN|nr:hypothetical protein [Streptomyces xanthii]QNS02644.1 hypothetical protein IAG42_02760 [Streptomyces xanthii]
MSAQPVQPVHLDSGAPKTAPAPDAPPFKPALVKTVFRGVTSMHVSRAAARAAGAVTRTVLTEIIDGARRAAAEEARPKLLPRDLIAAIDRNVELEVGTQWYVRSPTFRGLLGVRYDAEGAIVPTPRRSASRRPSAAAGAHRFEAGVRRLLRSQGATAVPALVRDLDGIASVFLMDLARDAAMVVREGGVKRFGEVILVMPGQTPPPPSVQGPHDPPTRSGDRRTVGGEDVLSATAMQLFGNIRERALAAAQEVI